MAVWVGEVIEYPDYTYSPTHDIWGNHFQGIQRIRDSNYLIISGANIGNRGNPSEWLAFHGFSEADLWQDQSDPAGHLFIAHLESRAAGGQLGDNVDLASLKPSASDRLVAAIELGGPFGEGNYLWHPGGISIVGDLAVIPVENHLTRLGSPLSRIYFVDVSDPKRPIVLKQSIDRTREPLVDKAGAAAMVRLADGRYLVAVGTASRLFFYPSRTARFEDGFDESEVVLLDESTLEASDGINRTGFGGSTINFLKQRDGQIYLVTFDFRRQPEVFGDPSVPGRHFASLYKVSFPSGILGKKPTLTKKAQVEFGELALDPAGWGHFSAAAGIHVTESGRLAAYAAQYFQMEDTGDLSLDSLRVGRGYFAPDGRGIIPMIEYWPANQQDSARGTGRVTLPGVD